MTPLLSHRSAPRRHRSSRLLSLEGLEERVVMSTTPVRAAAPAAEVRLAASAASRQRIDLPIVLTKLDITSAVADAAGNLRLAGTATGTLLGLRFTTPLTGTLTAGTNRLPSTLDLNLQPLSTSLLGLSAATGPIQLSLTDRAARGALDDLARSLFKNALQLGATGQSAFVLNSLLADTNVLGALNQTLDQAITRVGALTANAGNLPTTLSLSLSADRLRVSGLDVRLANSVGVILAGATSGGALGRLVGGLPTGTTNLRALTSQINGVLGQIVTLAGSLGGVLNPPGTGGGGTTVPPLTPPPTPAGASTVLDLNLPPIDLKLLGLEVKTSDIRVTVSALPGSGKLLGNLLNTVGGLLNLKGVNDALNNVLGNVVTLVNAASLSVNGATASTPVGATQGDVQVAKVQIAPVHLDLLGALVDTSPIELTITAHAGQGLLLGNVVAGLAGLLDPLGPDGKIDVPFLTNQIRQLNDQLDAALPGIPAPRPTPTNTTFPAGREILDLVVPPIDLNLLGLVLQTSTIEVNATAQSGSGKLLGNLLNGLLNTLSATPDQVSALNAQVNRLLGRVIGVLNNVSLTLPPNVLGTLSQALQTLSLPNLVTATPGASTPVLDLVVATPDTSPPVNVDLLGLVVTTSDIQARLSAQTGDGQILGNLVYNVSHLLDPGGAPALLSLLNALGI